MSRHASHKSCDACGARAHYECACHRCARDAGELMERYHACADGECRGTVERAHASVRGRVAEWIVLRDAVAAIARSRVIDEAIAAAQPPPPPVVTMRTRVERKGRPRPFVRYEVLGPDGAVAWAREVPFDARGGTTPFVAAAQEQERRAMDMVLRVRAEATAYTSPEQDESERE